MQRHCCLFESASCSDLRPRTRAKSKSSISFKLDSMVYARSKRTEGIGAGCSAARVERRRTKEREREGEKEKRETKSGSLSRGFMRGVASMKRGPAEEVDGAESSWSDSAWTAVAAAVAVCLSLPYSGRQVPSL